MGGENAKTKEKKQKRIDSLSSLKNSSKMVESVELEDSEKKDLSQTVDSWIQENKVEESKHSEKSINRSNYLGFHGKIELPMLEILENMTSKKFCGPTPESNWVIPHHLMAGAYPAAIDDDENTISLTSILKCGITTFVCLQQEYRHNGITEQMWRSGFCLRPYIFDALNILEKAKDNPFLAFEHPGSLNFIHFPIVDCAIGDDIRVLELSLDLAQRLRDGEIIYVHCWGGHGRTGTVISIVLHILYGISPSDAMHYVQRAHDLRISPMDVGSPQTSLQRNQVARIITNLEKPEYLGSSLSSAVYNRRRNREALHPKKSYSSISKETSREIQSTLNNNSEILVKEETSKSNGAQSSGIEAQSSTIVAQSSREIVTSRGPLSKEVLKSSECRYSTAAHDEVLSLEKTARKGSGTKNDNDTSNQEQSDKKLQKSNDHTKPLQKRKRSQNSQELQKSWHDSRYKIDGIANNTTSA